MMSKRSNDIANTEVLADIDFFEGFSEAELARVVELVTEVVADPGAQLTDQGRPGQVCYVIVSGTASVYVRGEYVASVGEGAMVGEMALIDHHPRNATVVADTEMKLLALDNKHFKTLLKDLPQVSERISARLNARLRQNQEG